MGSERVGYSERGISPSGELRTKQECAIPPTAAVRRRVSRPSKPARQLSFDWTVSKRTDIKRGRPAFRRPLSPTANPAPEPPTPIDGEGYPELEVQSPKRTSADGDALKRLNFFCSYLSPLCFFLPLFLRLFFNQLLGGLRNSSTSYCAEGPAGGIPVHPLLFTRLRGTRLESTGTVFFLEGQPGALVAAAPRFEVLLLGWPRCLWTPTLLSPCLPT